MPIQIPPASSTFRPDATVDIRPAITAPSLPASGAAAAAAAAGVGLAGATQIAQLPGQLATSGIVLGTTGTGANSTAQNFTGSGIQTALSLNTAILGNAQTAQNAAELDSSTRNSILQSQQRVQQNNLNTQAAITATNIQNTASRDSLAGNTANSVFAQTTATLGDQVSKAKTAAEAFKN